MPRQTPRVGTDISMAFRLSERSYHILEFLKTQYYGHLTARGVIEVLLQEKIRAIGEETFDTWLAGKKGVANGG